MNRYICIHGHFYQPPRENPWLEEVELQESAYPHHDWNERITSECYAPNTASRILDPDKKIIDIFNNFSCISFNMGPTLASWLEKHHPEVYEAILEADHTGRERFSGHGPAMAQVYNHMILPLAARRDKITQVLWGIHDFRHRFGRPPEGMWLPETAVDLETLDILAEHGISFTILAPTQARCVRPIDGGEGWDVSGGRVDSTQPYLCRLPSGRTIHLFFYDGAVSQEVAFGALLKNGETFAHRLTSRFSERNDAPQLVHIATDGETYGHHHRRGEMALSYCLYHLQARGLAELTVYGEFLERHPPTLEVEIFENTSWSCSHGVERWRSNCGCHTGAHPEWTQAWRGPLRDAMDMLRDRLAPLFEQRAAELLNDPWEARNAYIEVILDRSRETIDRFFAEHAPRNLTRREKNRALRLLEMQRYAMLSYTSCGWFFDEISGIETTQILKYASRAIQLAEEEGEEHLEADFKRILEAAPSNIPRFGNGAKVYSDLVEPSRIDLIRVGAHYAVSSLFRERLDDIRIYCYSVDNEQFERMEAGVVRLSVGMMRIVSNITWDERHIGFAALHLGDHNVYSCVQMDLEESRFAEMQAELKNAFDTGDTLEVIRIMEEYLGAHSFNLWHLFRDEQTKVLQEILRANLEEIEASFRRFLEQNYMTMNFLTELQVPLPKPLAMISEFTLNTDLQRVLEEADPDTDRLQRLIEDAQRWSVNLDREALGFMAGACITRLMSRVVEDPGNGERLQGIERIFRILQLLDLEMNLWEAQNIYFDLSKEALAAMRNAADAGDASAAEWVRTFRALGEHLGVRTG